MIEVCIDPQYNNSLLYKKDNLFMWSDVVSSGPWKDFDDYINKFKIKTVKLFEIEGVFDLSRINKI